MITFSIVELTPNQPYLVVGGGTVKPQMLCNAPKNTCVLDNSVRSFKVKVCLVGGGGGLRRCRKPFTVSYMYTLKPVLSKYNLLSKSQPSG